MIIAKDAGLEEIVLQSILPSENYSRKEWRTVDGEDMTPGKQPCGSKTREGGRTSAVVEVLDIIAATLKIGVSGMEGSLD